MRLEWLTYLKMIARTKSISTAADACFISQQALSKAIKSFEEELGVKLLIRTNQGVKLTEEGDYVLNVANQVLPLINEMENHFAFWSTSQLTGSLNIYSVPSIKRALLAKPISTFYKYYPNVSLSVKSKEENEIIQAALNNEIDLGFLSVMAVNDEVINPIPDALEFVPFAKHKFDALLSKNSPLAQYQQVSFSQLLENPVVLMPTNRLEDYNPYKLLTRFGTVNVRFADSYDLYNQFLADDLGFSICPDMEIFTQRAFSTPPYNFIRRPISDNVYSTIGYVYHKKRPKNQFIEYFLYFLNQV